VSVLENRVLIAALLAWSAAQVIKLPIEYARHRRLDWSLLLRAGGMPSSHSALVTATGHAIGLTVGFDSPIFALAAALALIVIYDATGIRRQAGRQAEIINRLVRDLVEGHTERLREVLGHSPDEAILGMLLGLGVAHAVIVFWPA
jgi:acid phosphatase family membrane protein YuiD